MNLVLFTIVFLVSFADRPNTNRESHDRRRYRNEDTTVLVETVKEDQTNDDWRENSFTVDMGYVLLLVI